MSVYYSTSSIMRCDGCRKRRRVMMHPIGLDLCAECARKVDETHVSEREDER